MNNLFSLKKGLGLVACALSLVAPSAMAQTISSFTSGDLVISTVSNSGFNTANNGLDTASPISLQEFSLGTGGTSATSVGTFTLPQTSSGSNSAISGEYGSASEGILEDSVNGQYMTIMGYGVNANTFNTAPTSTYGNAALGQTTSLTTGSYTTVARVVGLIGQNGSVDTSTALTGVYNTNNPRSAATVDGSSFYVSGQGVTGDGTGGIFYATRGATTATAINNNTGVPSGTPNGTDNAAYGTETRAVEIVNTGSGNTLMASRDFGASGTPNSSTDIRSFTNSSNGLPTSSAGLTVARVLPDTQSSKGNYGSINLTAALANGVNNGRIGTFVYLSPEQFFMASSTVMYVADSGAPKNGGAGAAGLGEGGLQKWVNTAGTWTLQYDLYAGLNLVNNNTANSATNTAGGVTGLFGLAGQVESDGTVELFATSYGVNELSQSYLYEITDTLSATTAGSESFTTLYTAGPNTASTGLSIRGVAFAPQVVPEPSTWALMIGGLTMLFVAIRRRNRA